MENEDNWKYKAAIKVQFWVLNWKIIATIFPAVWVVVTHPFTNWCNLNFCNGINILAVYLNLRRLQFFPFQWISWFMPKLFFLISAFMQKVFAALYLRQDGLLLEVLSFFFLTSSTSCSIRRVLSSDCGEMKKIPVSFGFKTCCLNWNEISKIED